MIILQSQKKLPLPLDQNALAAYEAKFAKMRSATEALYERQRLLTMCPPNWQVNARIHADGVSEVMAEKMFLQYQLALVQAIKQEANDQAHGVVWNVGVGLVRGKSEFGSSGYCCASIRRRICELTPSGSRQSTWDRGTTRLPAALIQVITSFGRFATTILSPKLSLLPIVH